MAWRLAVGGGSRSNGGSRRITEERGGLLNVPGRLDGSEELVRHLLDTIGNLNQENEHLKKDVAKREQFIELLQSGHALAQAQLGQQLTINKMDKQEYDDDLAVKEAELTRLRSQNEKLLAQLERTKPIDGKSLASKQASQAACRAKTQLMESQDDLAFKEAEQDELQVKNLQQMPQLKGKDEAHPNRNKTKKKTDKKKKKKATQDAGQAEVCKLPEMQGQLNQQLQGAHGKLAAKEEGLLMHRQSQLQELHGACSNRGQQHQAVAGFDLAAAAQAALKPVAVVSRCSSADDSQPAEPGTPELSELGCSRPRSSQSGITTSSSLRPADVQTHQIVALPWLAAVLQQRRQCC